MSEKIKPTVTLTRDLSPIAYEASLRHIIQSAPELHAEVARALDRAARVKKRN